MNDSTIMISADTSALTDSLSKIAEEMTAMNDAVFSSAAAILMNPQNRQKPPMPPFTDLMTALRP